MTELRVKELCVCVVCKTSCVNVLRACVKEVCVCV